jgi:SET domain-containing protein
MGDHMLIVRTYIAPSKIHGMGVFTAEPIEEGARVWVFDPTVDQEITADELAALPDTAREIALSRSFVRENGSLILSRDNGVFINHSGRPNISSEADGSIALRDLVKGEELTEDYRLLPPGACRAFLDRPSHVRALTFQHPNGRLWIITRWRASLGRL